MLSMIRISNHINTHGVIQTSSLPDIAFIRQGSQYIGVLFEAQCERAASLGHKVAGLIVDVDKPQAEALYARLGFTYLDDKDFFGHTMKHMVRNLK